MILQHLLAERRVEFKVRTAFFSPSHNPSATRTNGFLLRERERETPIEPSSNQLNHGRKIRGHYVTALIPNCAFSARHPFSVIAKRVSAYFSQ